MFNLPWYSWFNVLALPLMWMFMAVDLSIGGAPAWIRKLVRFHILAAVVCIFLYWNPQLYNTLEPGSHVLALLVIPFALWNMWSALSGFAETSFKAFRHTQLAERPTINTTPLAAIPDTQEIDILADDVDLDRGGTCSEAAREHEAVADEVLKLVSSKSSARERFDSFTSIFGGEDDADGIAVMVSLGGLVLYAAICLPPLYMSIRLLG